jgi:hypothetical protein
MSYADIADLSQDPEFRRRLGASLAQEARPRVPDAGLADIIMRNPEFGVMYFVPFVSVAPGFADAYAAAGERGITDPMLLSAVQDVWDEVAALYPAPAP